MNKEQRVALVTGGIGGIGTEICKGLVQAGRIVIAGYLAGEVNLSRQSSAPAGRKASISP
jgi:NAD(P)-dependent dehydrogenase (short-subunit alcohol dehydrogenase family)